MRLTHLALGTIVVGAAALANAHDAVACGGTFHPIVTTESPPPVTDHRMVFKVASSETILWDQVRYAGAPGDFAWVLPVHEGATIELSRDEFMTALDTSTRTTVRSPARVCRTASGGTQTYGDEDNGGGCGSSASSSSSTGPRPSTLDTGSTTADGGATIESDGVAVVSQSVIGPYQAVTLRAKEHEGITDWLTKNDFAIPDSIKPTIEAYTKEGFDFIALRLRPGQGVQAMRPVRVVTPGNDTTLPLRMVAAGAGAKASLTLWVISEARYEAQSYPNAVIDEQDLTWNGKTGRSNLTILQATALASHNGRTWLTEVSTPQAFELALRRDYTDQCTPIPQRLRPCDEDKLPGKDGLPDAGPNPCTEMVGGCHNWDDLEVASRGLRASNIWITRMRADLPIDALTTDLRLQPTTQGPVSAEHATNTFNNPNDDPCPNGVLRPPPSTSTDSGNPAPPDDGACTCRTTKPLHTQAGTWLLIVATTLAATRIARRRKRGHRKT